MFKTRLLTPERDYQTGRVIARQEVIEGNYAEFYDVADKEKEYDLDIKRHRRKRSLDANAYYHVLLNKIATAIGSSMAEVKNYTLSRYGQLEVDDDGKPIEILVPDEAKVEKREDIHLQATSELEYSRGRFRRWYRIVRGSHTYNTAEFSALLTGTISEAREAGLTDAEIMTPNERQALKEAYGVDI